MPRNAILSPSTLLAIALLFCPRLDAAVLISIAESNGDVTMTSTGGQLDIAALAYRAPYTVLDQRFRPSDAFFILGAEGSRVDGYILPLSSGPSLLGPLSTTFTTISTGGVIGISALRSDLYLPGGYNSGDPIAPGFATFASQSLSSMGLTPGIYTWNWGSGPNSDSVTLSVVPEPSSMSLVAFAVLATINCRTRSRC